MPWRNLEGHLKRRLEALAKDRKLKVGNPVTRIQALPQFFNSSDVVRAARWLIGKELVVKSKIGLMSGTIVETEAYGGENDLACHAYRKRTARNEAMYSEAGTVYVYFIYGMYFCLNIVTGPKDKAYAVLIRALRPTSGILEMASRVPSATRNLLREEKLCNGPGKLCKALAISRADHNGEHVLTSKKIWLQPGLARPKVTASTRIGISESTDLPWRFLLEGSAYVSRDTSL
jgi:DNA-3-methyladenine glycosylase